MAAVLGDSLTQVLEDEQSCSVKKAAKGLSEQSGEGCGEAGVCVCRMRCRTGLRAAGISFVEKTAINL